jgi:gluconate 2-dehydrogenase gamma chain
MVQILQQLVLAANAIWIKKIQTDPLPGNGSQIGWRISIGCIRQISLTESELHPTVGESRKLRPKSMRELNRRDFLLRTGTGFSAAWITANWPALLSAATHAHNAAKAATPPKFEFFMPEEAAEVEAITARIIPTDETPGAREAGVVYFIDRGLATFAADDQKTYREGLPDLQARVKQIFPSALKFSGLTAEQQDAVLQSFDENAPATRRGLRARPGAQDFFEKVRRHTIQGFLIDPEFGGNHDGVGWKVIGRDMEHTFQSPFGYYDKDYPGWQSAAKEADKT